MEKLIIAITGASGIVYGVNILQLLQKTDIETHLIMSKSAFLTLNYETKYTREYIESLASVVYNNNDISATIASGSVKTMGMIIAPCSINTMSNIASGNSDKLITRAADVTLKERRRLLLMVRECPFHLGHLRNMVSLTEMGAIIFPPIPQFYTNPTSIEDIVLQASSKALSMFNIDVETMKYWVKCD